MPIVFFGIKDLVIRSDDGIDSNNVGKGKSLEKRTEDWQKNWITSSNDNYSRKEGKSVVKAKLVKNTVANGGPYDIECPKFSPLT